MKKLLVIAYILLVAQGYGSLTKEDIIYILKNHKDKGFYYEGEVSKDTLKVVIDFETNSQKVFINFADGRVAKVITFYSTVMVLDQKPPYSMLEYLLRANNFNQSLGFFYIYYNLILDKWFIDYAVRIRQDDITKSSLIDIIKIVSLYSYSARAQLSQRLFE
ncbi:MAG: hypothetical protein RMJ37_01840 [Spirochaetia bacterium]|nr:hypothetical protein [Spirochaetota bacterium]MCX8096618.1 hypothetical protein [Spirochaetota bacterium]MDW8112065.1 hypothetical protein [Spirochaetia bacterium]